MGCRAVRDVFTRDRYALREIDGESVDKSGD